VNMLEVSEAEVASLKEQVAMASTEALTRILEVLADAELRLRDAASKKILLEVTLLKAIEARSAVNLDAVLKQLNELRAPGSTGVSPASPPAPVGTRSTASPSSSQTAVSEEKSGTRWNASLPTSAPAPAALAETPTGAAGLEEIWARLVEAVGRVSPFTRTYLVDAYPVSFAGSVFTIGFDPEFGDQVGLVDNARNHTLLQTKLAELGHPNSQIRFVKAEAPAGRVPVTAAPATPPPTAVKPPPPPAPAKPTSSPTKEKTAPVPFNKDDFKNDPLIQKALEIFKGQIVEVRA